MLFRQLFDPTSSTYTYLLADEETREAVIIDPVIDQLDRDTRLLQELGLTLPKGSDVYGWARVDPANPALDLAADTHDVAGALVVARAEIDGMTQKAVGRPLGESHLGDQVGPDPVRRNRTTGTPGAARRRGWRPAVAGRRRSGPPGARTGAPRSCPRAGCRRHGGGSCRGPCAGRRTAHRAGC